MLETSEEIEQFINKHIRNSAVESFQNLRLNTALIAMLQLGSGPASEGGAMFPLFPPSNFNATAASSSQINLSWDIVGNAEAYVLESSPNGSTGWIQIYSGSGTSTSHTGLSTGTHYYYRIRATAEGISDSSYATDDATTL